MPKQKTTKKEILQKCWEEIHLHGYRNSSISKLAKAAGLGKAGLLHHFQSKEALMHAVLDYAIDFFENYALAVVNEPLPLEQRLEKLLRRQNRLTKLQQRGCFFTNIIMEVGQEGTFNEKLLRFYEEWRETIAQLLAEKMSLEAARHQAYLLHIQYEGAVTLYKLSGDEYHLEFYVSRSIESMKTN
ncbi:MAG: TetR/AcrR family transcriptional regulator [Bacteroidota bacterium]